MTIFSLTMQQAHAEILTNHLIQPDGKERAAYVLCGLARIKNDPWGRQAHERYCVMDVVPVADNDTISSSPSHITWSTNSFAKVLKQAEANDQVVGIVHNHPEGLAGFSSQDDANEPDLVQMAQNRNGPGTRLISLVLTPEGEFAGRVWRHPTAKGFDNMDLIKIVGNRLKLHYPGRGSGETIAALDRQARAFGGALNGDLRKLRVGIVGCGGTGSAIAMLLVRLGIGQVVLFDNDIVDITNLNRLHGARQSDADAMRPKVDVVARAMTELGLGVRVVPVNAWIGDPECRDALKSCDVVFGCTDDHDGRLFLNRFAYYYLTPVIDIGLGIDPGDETTQKVRSLEGRVTILLPGATCLMCRGAVSPQLAADEAMKRLEPAEYEKRKAEAYVHGTGNPSPAVVTFTTEVACMAVNELVHRLQGFRGEDGAAANRVRKFDLCIDRLPGHKPRPHCAICDTGQDCGRADTTPFLGRVG